MIVNNFLTLEEKYPPLLCFVKKISLLFSLLFSTVLAQGQFLMDMIDTTKQLGKTAYQTIGRFNHIRISGYMQPQYQVSSAKGSTNYSGGNFAPASNNRFMLRRGRIRFDYLLSDEKQRNKLQFVFQFDGTERGVNIRDFWGRYWENKYELFSFTTGMFARPFGYEVNLSSGDREAPERGRMSQILVKTERDLGFMVSMEKRKKTKGWKFFRIDAGIFNGQGLIAPGEYDNYKDFIGQIVIKPLSLNSKWSISGGLSVLQGAIVQNADFSYRLKETNGKMMFTADSTAASAGGRLPRQYQGANVQFGYMSKWGKTELRGEVWNGTQPGTLATTETPGLLTLQADGKYTPLYIRNFRGGFITFLQPLGSSKNQLIIKYDWYDPNTKAKASQIGAAGYNYGEADIMFSTLGAGFLHHINENLKIVFFHEWIRNEHTSLNGYASDKSDNVFSVRTQFRF